MQLTIEQEKAINLIENNTAKTLLIAGHAGTGKTSILRAALDRMVPQLEVRSTPILGDDGEEIGVKIEGGICLVAPTHKALGVLKSKMPDYGPAIQYRTLASLLCKFPVIDLDGNLRYSGDSPDRREYVKIFIDEASMISYKDLGELKDIVTPPLIFLGDPAQLPPINESLSEVFKTKEQVTLTEVHRQSGPLADYLTKCRDYTRTNCRKRFLIDENEIIPGVKYQDYPDVGIFGPEWEENPDTYRVLCWTNKQVNSFNQMARYTHRGARWGFDVGERVMTGDAIMKRGLTKDGRWEDIMIVPSSTEMVIKEVSEGEYHGFRALKVMTDIAEKAIAAHSSQYSRFSKDLWVLNPQDLNKYEVQLKNYYEAAKVAQREFDEWRNNNPTVTKQSGLFQEKRKIQSKAWVKFYSCKSLFADIRHVYAMTVHRSQGSQFVRGYVDGNDIRKCKKIGDHNRLWYTAISRFSQGFDYR